MAIHVDKTRHSYDMCYNEIGLCVDNKKCVALGCIVYTIGDTSGLFLQEPIHPWCVNMGALSFGDG